MACTGLPSSSLVSLKRYVRTCWKPSKGRVSASTLVSHLTLAMPYQPGTTIAAALRAAAEAARRHAPDQQNIQFLKLLKGQAAAEKCGSPMSNP